MQKTKIEWATMTWNPVTGCLNGCEYCYAKKIAERFGGHGDKALQYEIEYQDKNIKDLYRPLTVIRRGNKESIAPFPYMFTPTFHRYRLGEPKKVKKPQRIFVVSMGDLFGPWVPEAWIKRVFEACMIAPQHKYMFLTKFPRRYRQLAINGKLPFLPNFYYGTTATSQDEIDHAFTWTGAKTFLSVEPILEDLHASDLDIYSVWMHGLMIFGAETGNRKGKVVPKREWFQPLVDDCIYMGGAVFMKDSMIPIVGEDSMFRDLPEGLQL